MIQKPDISQPPDQGVGPPPSRPSDILLTELSKLQTDGEYIKRDLGETRADMKEVRDRLARLEERVGHLPSKGFIIVVVTSVLVITGALITLAPKIQSLLVPPAQPASVAPPP